MTTTDNLLPCPFCGAEPMEHAIEPHTHSAPIQALGIPDHTGSHVVECGCGAGLIADTRSEVLAMWNRRAYLSEQEGAAPKGEPDEPRLPYDVKVGAATFRKGVALSTFVMAAQRWHREAFPDFYTLTDEQKAANFARLQGAVPPAVFRNGQWEGQPISQFPELQEVVRRGLADGTLEVSGATPPRADAPIGEPQASAPAPLPAYWCANAADWANRRTGPGNCSRWCGDASRCHRTGGEGHE